MNWLFWTEVAVKASIVALAIQGAVAYLVLMERRTASFIQDRIGPNRCGPFGLLQPIADGVKLLFKEDILPAHVNRPFFILAPVITLIPALATLAVVPFGAPLVFETDDGPREVLLQVADVNVGVLYVFAVASLGVYGLALGGWASNSKFSLLGGIRASAQMISYELTLTLSALAVILSLGSLRLSAVIAEQGAWPWEWNLFGFGRWDEPVLLRVLSIVPLLIAGILFMISALAETNRMPFDMPEAESELVSGYHTEFSSMKFGLFFLAEYANMLTASALVATLFLGGWLFPFHDAAWLAEHPIVYGMLSLGTFVLKTIGFMFVMMWIRWTLPRFRFDQLMGLGWKWMLPASLACVVAVAVLRAFVPWSP